MQMKTVKYDAARPSPPCLDAKTINLYILILEDFAHLDFDVSIGRTKKGLRYIRVNGLDFIIKPDTRWSILKSGVFRVISK